MAHVRGHTRDGHHVRPHDRSGSRGQKAADAGLGTLVGVGLLTQALLGLTEAVVTILAFVLMALFGSLLGVRFYKRTRRRPWSKRRKRVRVRRRRPGSGPPAKQGSFMPWGGSAPWASPGDRSAVYRRLNDGSWKRVG